MDSETLREEHFPRYSQLKESQKWFIIVMLSAIVSAPLINFLVADAKALPLIYACFVVIFLISGGLFLHQRNQISKFDKLDLKRLLEATSGDVEMEEDLLNALRQNVVDRLPLLKAGLQNKIKDQAVLYSHDFKGSCATIGLEGIRKVAFEMERLSKEDQLESAAQLYPQLENEIKEGFELLETYIRNKKKKVK